MSELFHGYLRWEPTRAHKRTYDKRVQGASVGATLSQFNTLHPLDDYTVDTEIRTLNDGRVFVGVTVRRGSDELLFWNNITPVQETEKEASHE